MAETFSVWKQDIQNFGKVVTGPRKKSEMGERGLRVKFIPVCDCQTSLLHELTEATASQGLGLEPDHVCSVVMPALMWPSALHSAVQPIFGMQTRRLLPVHSFGN